jgi:hypothetical protein
MAVVQRIAGARVKDVDPVTGVGHGNLLPPAASGSSRRPVICVRAKALLQLGRDPLTGRLQATIEATMHRLLAGVDPDALDQVIGRWLACQQPLPSTGRSS